MMQYSPPLASHGAKFSFPTVVDSPAAGSPVAMQALRGRMPTREELQIAAGDSCKAVSLITVRAGESLASEVVTTLPIGAVMKVLEMGSERRAKISAGSLKGWLTLKTRAGDPLILKRRAESLDAIDKFKEGGEHELKTMVTVREGESLETPIATQLKPGLSVTILEISSTNKRRAKIKSENVEGWITLATKNGDLMLSYCPPKRQESVQCTEISISTIKALLEAGRSGHLDQVRSICEATDGLRARDDGRLNLNASDIRGRTTLIYAAAFGNVEVVEYLLAQKDVDVNAIDDTQKSALHHASKKARTSPEETRQSEIIRCLVGASAYVEARDHNGCTALMFAVANGDDVATSILLDANANVNLKDYEGHSPLEYAVNFNHTDVAQLLRSHGAEENESDREDLAGLSGKKTKPKKKAVAKKKEKSVQKAIKKESMGLTTLDTMGVGLADITVIEDSGVEDEKAKLERAISKLQDVMKSTSSPKELESAIKEAGGAGASEELLEAGAARLSALKVRIKAREQLHVAMEERSVEMLEEAIKSAEETNVERSDIERAKAMLQEELPRQKARENLIQAQQRGDATSLKAALEEARRVKLDESELNEFDQLLRGAESKEKAEMSLKKAIEEKNVHSLRFAIQQAKEAGVEASQISTAEDVLKIEEPKHAAREALAAAIEKVDIAALRNAISEAKNLELDPSEYSEAEAVLEAEEKKVRLMKEVNEAMEESAGVDFNSLDLLKDAKERLTNVVKAAKDAGCPEAELLAAEQRRRKIHNGIEDLKGSVRVFCRVRPLSSKEKGQGDTDITRQVDGMTLALKQQFSEVNFGFDAVFTPGTQEQVFEDCRDLVQSAVDGYNVTMFAYGQTGAGKTFTMYGVPGQEGTAPRTIDELFRITARDSGRFNFTVMASMLELYRNDLVDLLNKSSVQKNDEFPLKIRMEKSGMVTIEHLVEIECGSAAELMKVLDRGNEMRTVAATAMNSESSRSHSLLIIKIVSVNKETRDQLRGKILMCDLAGSERLKKSEVTGDMQKEAIEINKSLTALGDVIEALTKKMKQIPYRNHKLTQVMQDSLGGTAKTLMFVNCSPASSNADETTMSLKYATRAKNVTNKAVRSSMALARGSQSIAPAA